MAMVGPFGMKPKGTMAARALPLAKALVSHGHQVAMFLPPWSWPSDSGRVWEDGGVRIENVPIFPAWMIGPRLVRRVSDWKPDAVHCFKPKSFSGISAWMFWQLRRAGRARARLVIDEDDWEGAGGWNDIEKYSAIQRRFFSWQETWGLTHCDSVTVASKALETIAWSMGGARSRVHYLPYGINPFASKDREAGASVRNELGLGQDPVLLLYTRFFEFGLERLVHVLSRISQLLPRARYLVVGKGLFAEENVLGELAKECGFSNKVAYAGWVPEDKLPGYFAAADAAIYPLDETLVNRCKCLVKLGDLLTAGVAVVAEAVGQAQEYIENEATGVLVEAGGVEEFSRTTVRVLQDSSLRDRLGSNAAAHMAQNYNWGRLVRIAEMAYEGDI